MLPKAILVAIIGLVLFFVISANFPFKAQLLQSIYPKEESMAATGYPTGFTESRLVNGLNSPTAMSFAPDGRLFVAQQGGALRVIKNGTLLATPFVQLTVDSFNERGLLGIAFDPNFATNNFVYLYYTTTNQGINRISRFTANGDIAQAGSEAIFLDLDPHGAGNHNGGAMYFGKDGKLYVSTGDNASGDNAQNVTNFHGKLLRFNPVLDNTGTPTDERIPTDNPASFATTNGTQTPSGKYKAIAAMGLRNPFTFAIQPWTAGTGGSGKIYINDVGDNGGIRWEEINDSSTLGQNFGWPVAYGMQGSNGYTRPLYTYQAEGCAITGGTFYNPSQSNFPQSYVGDYFFSDFCGDWIKVMDATNPSNITTFASGIAAPVDIKVGPDGALYYLARDDGAIYKVTFGGLNVVMTATPTQGATPLTVNFSAQGSTDPSGGTLSYSWNFGDNTANGSGVTTSHVYSQNGTYNAVLTVTSTSGKTDTRQQTITVGSSFTVDFNNYPSTNAPLNGEFPAGAINWGTGQWFISDPFGQLNSKNFTFNGAGVSSGTITFIGAKRLSKIDAFNGSTTSATTTLSCSGQASKTFTLQPSQLLSLTTGWTNTCSPVTLQSSNGWDTNYDNLVYDLGPGNATPTPSGTTPPNLAPTATITTPTTGTLYNGGQTINFAGTATDPEDGTLPASAFSWKVELNHSDPGSQPHAHPVITPPSADGITSGSFAASKVQDATTAYVLYRITLTVTDSKGLTSTVTRDVNPRKMTFTVTSSPLGLQIAVDSIPRTTPFSAESVVGMTHSLDATSPQTLSSIGYQFSAWSDGGAKSHTFDAPTANTSYLANYTQIQGTPTPIPTVPPTVVPTPVFLPGDADKNGRVDIFDYNIILRDYGKTGALQGDLDKDNDCDIFDYNIVLRDYGKTS